MFSTDRDLRRLAAGLLMTKSIVEGVVTITLAFGFACDVGVIMSTLMGRHINSVGELENAPFLCVEVSDIPSLSSTCIDMDSVLITMQSRVPRPFRCCWLVPLLGLFGIRNVAIIRYRILTTSTILALSSPS